ncbi:MAG: hypothetical protein IJG07_12040 [Prevotella sp.]|nr:hypothetical protein [Prevotella sp.]
MADFQDISSFDIGRGGGEDISPDSRECIEMIWDMYRLCLGMKSLSEALPMLYLMEKCLRRYQIRDPKIISLPEKVEEHFSDLNKPQPSVKYEGCHFYQDTQGGDIKNGNSSDHVVSRDISISGHMNVGTRNSSADDYDYSDEEIAIAIVAICGMDKPLCEKRLWAAVYWCLRWYCNFPVKGTDFCTRIDSLHLPKDLDPQCCYDNIRRLVTLSFMGQDCRDLDKVKASRADEDFLAECRVVVKALVRELNKVASKHP